MKLVNALKFPKEFISVFVVSFSGFWVTERIAEHHFRDVLRMASPVETD